jgi:hypothetical protein
MHFARQIIQNPPVSFLAGFLLCIFCALVPSVVFAQGGVMQYGPVNTGHPAMWYGNGAIGDGGSPQGGPVGALGLTGIGVTNSTPQAVCATSGPITTSYAQLCLGFNNGTPQITLGGYPQPTSLQFLINGNTYTIPSNLCSACGTMAAQNANNVSISGGSISNVALSGLTSAVFNGATLTNTVLSNTDLTLTTAGQTLTAQPLTSWLGAATVPNKTVFIGSVISGYANLANPANIPQILASGKIGLYQHANGNALVGAATMAQIWNTFSGTGVGPGNGSGQSIGEVGGGFDQRQYFTPNFTNPGGNYYPNEVNMDVGGATGTYTATSSDKYPGTVYTGYYTSADIAPMETYGPIAAGYGAKNSAAFIFSPNGTFGPGYIDGDDPFATSGYWANVRAFALYSGAMVLDVPPSYANYRGTQYVNLIEQMIIWGVQQHIRVTVLVSPYAAQPDSHGNTQGCGFDPYMMENTQSLFGQFHAAGAMPTSWVVLNYAQNNDPSCLSSNHVATENDIAPNDTTPESLNVIALYLARVTQPAPAGTAPSQYNGIADAGLLTSQTPVPAISASLSLAHVGPLNLSDVNGYGSMATQESSDVHITGGIITGSPSIELTSVPIWLDGDIVQGSNGVVYLNANSGNANTLSFNVPGGAAANVKVDGTLTLNDGIIFGTNPTISGTAPIFSSGLIVQNTGGEGAIYLNTTAGNANTLNFSIPGGASAANVKVDGLLTLNDGITFGTNPVISGTAPIYTSGLIVQTSSGAVFLNTTTGTNTLDFSVPGGGAANVKVDGLLTLNDGINFGTNPTISGTAPVFTSGLIVQTGSSSVFLNTSTGTNTLSFSIPGGAAATVKVDGPLDLNDGIVFGAGGSVISGQAPIFTTGILIQGAGGSFSLNQGTVANTLQLVVPGNTFPATFEASLIGANQSIGAITKPGVFSASGPTLGWNYNTLGDSDLFLGPGTSLGGLNIYAVNASGIVQEAPGSPIFSISATGQVNITGGGLIAGLVTSSNTGQFYQNNNANVFRFADRTLLGAAASNPANSTRTTTPTDWLSSMMAATPVGPYATYGAQTASLARYGSIGFLGASRSSDAYSNSSLLGYTPAPIGIASWGVNDSTASTTLNAWAYYGEAWRETGVNIQPTFGMELEAVNFGGTPTGYTTPYQTNVGGGVYGLQRGSGGGQSTTGSTPVGNGEAVMSVVANPTPWRGGIVFGATSLLGTTGTTGDTGYAEAISLGKNQAIAWHTPETVSGAPGFNTGGFIRSTVTLGADASRMEFQNSGIIFSNTTGLPIFSVLTNATPTNTLEIQSGATTQAAGLYVLEGSGGSANLGLYPASGGELQVTSASTTTGATAAVVPAYGFLHMNVNGSEVRIPLYSPSQAGG